MNPVIVINTSHLHGGGSPTGLRGFFNPMPLYMYSAATLSPNTEPIINCNNLLTCSPLLRDSHKPCIHSPRPGTTELPGRPT